MVDKVEEAMSGLIEILTKQNEALEYHIKLLNEKIELLLRMIEIKEKELAFYIKAATT